MRDHVVDMGRSLRSRPGALCAAGLTLTLAIGVNAAMVGLVGRAFLSRPEQIADPDRLVTLGFERGDGEW